MRKCSVIAFITLASLFAASLALEADERVVSRIAFGSCNKHDRDQALWNDVKHSYPQLLIWRMSLLT
jgi:hypothetical protein